MGAAAGSSVDLQRMRGLVSAEQHHVGASETSGSHLFYEAVGGSASALVRKNLRDLELRGRYGARSWPLTGRVTGMMAKLRECGWVPRCS